MLESGTLWLESGVLEFIWETSKAQLIQALRLQTLVGHLVPYDGLPPTYPRGQTSGVLRH